jgi:protease-4
LIGSVLLNLILLAVLSSTFEEGAAGGLRPLRKVEVEPAATQDAVALVRVEGIITEAPMGGWGAPEGTDFQYLKQQVKQAMEDSHVKAVVLKVNSPGGGASASDMMLHELKKLAAVKPMVVHMGTVAASGGFYVSMAGQEIIAQRTCITGSIGVIGETINLRALMQDKLGIEVYTFKSGPYKDVGNPFRDMTPEEQAYLQDTLIRPMYERFLSVVGEGRKKLSADQIRNLADGRVYTAEQAVANGLVDKIGFLEDAIDEAKRLAGIKQARVIEYKRQLGLLELLGLSAQTRGAPLLNINRDTIRSLAMPEVLMLWKG